MALDVLVVGAGPVGLTLAVELKRFGLNVRIVDKNAARTDKSKALVVWPRTLELLDRSGVSAALIAAGLKSGAAHLRAGAKSLADISFGALETPHPFALMVPQSETERVLEEHLAGLGVTVERNTELVSFADSGATVSAVLRSGAGEETIDTAWLVGCDGAHSTLRHQLGLSFEGDTLPTDWMLADVHAEGMPNAGDPSIFFHDAGVLATFPIKSNRMRVIAEVGLTPKSGTRPDPVLADAQAVMDARGPGGVTLSDPVWLAHFSINERKVKDYRAGRVFLAGDAAHIHSPAGGQGMNTGMHDVCNLAWKLALVQRGLMKDDLLTSYSAERSPIGDQVLRETGLLTRAATLHSKPLEALRNAAISMVMGLSAGRNALAEQMSELSIGYAKSPLNFESKPLRGPRAGERAPLRGGEVFGAELKFALCAKDDADAQQFVACFPELIEPEVRAPYVEGGFWLVRPDEVCGGRRGGG